MSSSTEKKAFSIGHLQMTHIASLTTFTNTTRKRGSTTNSPKCHWERFLSPYRSTNLYSISLVEIGQHHAPRPTLYFFSIKQLATDCWHPIAYQIILILFIQTIVVNIKATCQILNTFIEIADQECLGNTITSF